MYIVSQSMDTVLFAVFKMHFISLVVIVSNKTTLRQLKTTNKDVQKLAPFSSICHTLFIN